MSRLQLSPGALWASAFALSPAGCVPRSAGASSLTQCPLPALVALAISPRCSREGVARPPSHVRGTQKHAIFPSAIPSSPPSAQRGKRPSA